MLAKNVNANAGCLMNCGVLAPIASKVAPTGDASLAKIPATHSDTVEKRAQVAESSGSQVPDLTLLLPTSIDLV